MKVRTTQCRFYVQALLSFHTGRSPLSAPLWGEWIDDRYVVFSLTGQNPIYLHWRGVWFSDSSSDSFASDRMRHRYYAHPGTDIVLLLPPELYAIWGDGELIPSAVARLSKTKPMPDNLMAILAAAKMGVL